MMCEPMPIDSFLRGCNSDDVLPCGGSVMWLHFIVQTNPSLPLRYEGPLLENGPLLMLLFHTLLMFC
jgi:hypothetical protein